uniref:Peptidase A1 domain-containing protein n=1 Tax=Kalanchoe fedtschenkoi TaxID=63787 RepID=A0A7N0UZ28_KALFE
MERRACRTTQIIFRVEDNDGVSSSIESSVIGLGLGLGQESLTSQNKSGFINFGENAVILGIRVVTTPMSMKWISSLYFITLNGFTIDGERVNFIGYGAYGKNEDNMLIDSGAHFTYLPSDNYENFENTVKKHISVEPLKHSVVPGYNLCYRSPNFSPPIITTNFDGGDVKRKSYNTFIYKNRVTCLAFFPWHESPIGIYDNTAQTNFLVEYD